MKGWDQRFGGIERLVGLKAARCIQGAHACIIGIGGVGSWAAEALARSGIGQLSLIDMDDICITNTNRQIHATTESVGLSKVEVMKERILAFHPECQVEAHHRFFNESTASDGWLDGADVIIDAIDRASAKCLILKVAREKGIAAICTGAAGGRVDPFQIQTADLSQVHHDRLLQKFVSSSEPPMGFRDLDPWGSPVSFHQKPLACRNLLPTHVTRTTLGKSRDAWVVPMAMEASRRSRAHSALQLRLWLYAPFKSTIHRHSAEQMKISHEPGFAFIISSF